MQRQIMKFIRITFTLVAIALVGHTAARAQDALPSWNDGPAKQAIVDFVRTTTEAGGARFVPLRSALPPSTRTAPSGSSIRCTPR